ncbi:MAG: GDP-L-fucose synthase [Marinilabiliaceae bacterium]|nr:GDP-L-fucose synthase [Marinilabiliaceae bacterium]
MKTESKIFVAGHKGLVGSSIVRTLQAKGYNNIICKTRQEVDLSNLSAVYSFFESEKPEYVVLAAAKVGGIMANNTYRADFIFENLQIQNNVISACWKFGVKKMLFLGSSCIYPKAAPQPIKENYLLTDILEYTNEPYAISKIAGIKMCESFNLQYGTNFIAVMPTNLYGPNDNYDLEKSHVLPAMIRKMHLGKCLYMNDWTSLKHDLNKRPVEGVNGEANNDDILSILSKYGIVKDEKSVKICLWGSGSPYREFLHSDDMADACVYLMEKIDFDDLKREYGDEIRNTHINIGTGDDITIKDLAYLIKSVVGFKGDIEWDSTKPDGTFRKLLDVSKMKSLGWQAQIQLREGIDRVYSGYLV